MMYWNEVVWPFKNKDITYVKNLQQNLRVFWQKGVEYIRYSIYSLVLIISMPWEVTPNTHHLHTPEWKTILFPELDPTLELTEKELQEYMNTHAVTWLEADVVYTNTKRSINKTLWKKESAESLIIDITPEPHITCLDANGNQMSTRPREDIKIIYDGTRLLFRETTSKHGKKSTKTIRAIGSEYILWARDKLKTWWDGKRTLPSSWTVDGESYNVSVVLLPQSNGAFVARVLFEQIADAEDDEIRPERSLDSDALAQLDAELKAHKHGDVRLLPTADGRAVKICKRSEIQAKFPGWYTNKNDPRLEHMPGIYVTLDPLDNGKRVKKTVMLWTEKYEILSEKINGKYVLTLKHIPNTTWGVVLYPHRKNPTNLLLEPLPIRGGKITFVRTWDRSKKKHSFDILDQQWHVIKNVDSYPLSGTKPHLIRIHKDGNTYMIKMTKLTDGTRNPEYTMLDESRRDVHVLQQVMWSWITGIKAVERHLADWSDVTCLQDAAWNVFPASWLWYDHDLWGDIHVDGAQVMYPYSLYAYNGKRYKIISKNFGDYVVVHLEELKFGVYTVRPDVLDGEWKNVPWAEVILKDNQIQISLSAYGGEPIKIPMNDQRLGSPQDWKTVKLEWVHKIDNAYHTVSVSQTEGVWEVSVEKVTQGVYDASFAIQWGDVDVSDVELELKNQQYGADGQLTSLDIVEVWNESYTASIWSHKIGKIVNFGTQLSDDGMNDERIWDVEYDIRITNDGGHMLILLEPKTEIENTGNDSEEEEEDDSSNENDADNDNTPIPENNDASATVDEIFKKRLIEIAEWVPFFDQKVESYITKVWFTGQQIDKRLWYDASSWDFLIVKRIPWSKEMQEVLNVTTTLAPFTRSKERNWNLVREVSVQWVEGITSFSCIYDPSSKELQVIAFDNDKRDEEEHDWSEDVKDDVETVMGSAFEGKVWSPWKDASTGKSLDDINIAAQNPLFIPHNFSIWEKSYTSIWLDAKIHFPQKSDLKRIPLEDNWWDGGHEDWEVDYKVEEGMVYISDNDRLLAKDDIAQIPLSNLGKWFKRYKVSEWGAKDRYINVNLAIWQLKGESSPVVIPIIDIPDDWETVSEEDVEDWSSSNDAISPFPVVPESLRWFSVIEERAARGKVSLRSNKAGKRIETSINPTNKSTETIRFDKNKPWVDKIRYWIYPDFMTKNQFDKYLRNVRNFNSSIPYNEWRKGSYYWLWKKTKEVTETEMNRRNEFISDMAPWVIEFAKKYRISPAVMLAQLIHESNFGTSELCKMTYNFFNIKTWGSKYWYGPTVGFRDDDADDLFRVYPPSMWAAMLWYVRLMGASRYKWLKKHSVDDTDSWIEWLVKANFATDKGYAKALKNNISLYNLDKYNQQAIMEAPELGKAIWKEAEASKSKQESASKSRPKNNTSPTLKPIEWKMVPMQRPFSVAIPWTSNTVELKQVYNKIEPRNGSSNTSPVTWRELVEKSWGLVIQAWKHKFPLDFDDLSLLRQTRAKYILQTKWTKKISFAGKQIVLWVEVTEGGRVKVKVAA